MIEVVRTVEDAMEFARQIHDMNHGDMSLMHNTDRALMILYKKLLTISESPVPVKKKRGRPRKTA